MKTRKLTLCLALGLLGYGTLASAHNHDDRWYVAPSAGAVFTDNKRDADDALSLGVGIGRFFHPRIAVDFDVSRSDADLQVNRGSWENVAFMATGRLFLTEGEGWRPYAALGAGWLRHDRDGSDNGTAFGFQAGAGLQTAVSEDVNIRAEVLYRYDGDDETIPTRDDYADMIAQAAVTIALGDRPAAPVEPVTPPPPPEQPAAKTCAELDDDADGVNNCDDKCPATPAGTMVGRDGCPVPVSIDLRGVNFDFDKCTLRADAIAILDEAVKVLSQHAIKVEVAGHTDAIGTDAYNQKLSECRAKVVAEYLGGNGVASDRIAGINGYGESKPIDTNDTAEGRARNRRTELNVQQ